MKYTQEQIINMMKLVMAEMKITYRQLAQKTGIQSTRLWRIVFLDAESSYKEGFILISFMKY